jgi:protein-L-isoaspartate(D-aspartate) O-methyltransferase
MPDFDSLRAAMVEHQIAGRGIRNPRLLDACRSVPRHRFVPQELIDRAYADSPLPIGNGQTISQPYIVARMIDTLQLDEDARVLDIGTGSGYAAAIISRLVDRVYSVERILPLLECARSRFSELGYTNIETLHDNGSLGWPGHAPYDAIVAAAAAPEVPPRLRDQLKPGGRLVLPIGDRARLQTLICEQHNGADGFSRQVMGEVRFVPLVTTADWRTSF